MNRFVLIVGMLFTSLFSQAKDKNIIDDIVYSLECFSKIARGGIDSQSWNIDSIYSDSVLCEQYLLQRSFEVVNDTLIVEFIEENGIGEIRLTIENDSLVIANFILKVPMELDGKSKRHMNGNESLTVIKEYPVRFYYRDKTFVVDMFYGTRNLE